MDDYNKQRIRKEFETENSQHFKKQIAGFAILFVVGCVIFLYWRSQGTDDNHQSQLNNNLSQTNETIKNDKNEKVEAEKQKDNIIKRKHDILTSIQGEWRYQEHVQDKANVEKLYTYRMQFSNNEIVVHRSYYNYVAGVGSSDEKENVTYKSTYSIKNENDITASDNDTYFLDTKGDGWEGYKIEYRNGHFSNLSFETLSSTWQELSR